MKYIFTPILMGILYLTTLASEERFHQNGSLEIGETFYGNAGSYKTQTSHTSMGLNYNFTENLEFQLQWDRTWNMFTYNDIQKEQDNKYSQPKFQLNYNYLTNTKIRISSNLSLENQSNFNNSNNNYIVNQINFDFVEYIPKLSKFNATQFALSPIYVYGWSENSNGDVNSAILSLLTNWELLQNFTLTLNIYAFREWYKQSFEIGNKNKTYSNANYFMFLAWLQYSKELYKINKDTSLSFNFTGGFDPYVFSNKKSNWNPFIVGNEMYQWLEPTVMDGNYNSTYVVFALPQFEISHKIDNFTQISIFGGIKYSNQVWGNSEKDWKFQPQVGINLIYNF